MWLDAGEVAKALELLENALDVEPGSAQAWVGLI
jgi:Tfp pilus assembly protein PilF